MPTTYNLANTPTLGDSGYKNTPHSTLFGKKKFHGDDSTVSGLGL
jgi:hypothetical protein